MKVSVIIPVYNAAAYLDRCITSALNQKQTYEVLLIDDRSTDGSIEKCHFWANNNYKVKLFKNTGPKGAGAARNLGVQKAIGDYIAFLDADDYYLDGRFNFDEKAFSAHSDIVAVANSLKIDTNGQQKIVKVNGIYWEGEIFGYRPSNEIINPYKCNRGNNILITALTIKRKVFETLENFDTSLIQHEDSDFIHRLIFKHKVLSGIFEKPKVIYNLHENNSTYNTTDAIYFGRTFKKKILKFSIQNKLKPTYIIYRFLSFVETDYLWIFKKQYKYKKLMKFCLMPLFVFRAFSKNDPPYIKNRKINPF